MHEEIGINGEDLKTPKKSVGKTMANNHASNVKSTPAILVQTRKSMRRISKSRDESESFLEEKETKKSVIKTTNGVIDEIISNPALTNGDGKSHEKIPNGSSEEKNNPANPRGPKTYAPARRSLRQQSRSSTSSTNDDPDVKDDDLQKEINELPTASNETDGKISFKFVNSQVHNDAECPELKNENSDNFINHSSTTNGDEKSEKSPRVSGEKIVKQVTPSRSTTEPVKNGSESKKIETPKRRGRPKRSQPIRNQLITNFFTPKKVDNTNNNPEDQESPLEFVDSNAEIKHEIESEQNHEKTELETPKRHPGRPRKRRHSNSTPSLPTPEEVPLPPRKRTRKISSETDGKGLSESDSEEKTAEKKLDDDKPYVPRVRSKKSNTQSLTKFLKIEPNKSSTCGKCKSVVSNWPFHNLSVHYNTGWLEGEKEPDFSDQSFLKDLKRALDKVKKKRFTCELCKATLNSVDGFISHILFCGKTDEEREALMWKCPVCYRVVKPSSVYSHERAHKNQKEPKTNKQNFAVLSSDKSIRKAAEKARKRFADLDDGSTNGRISNKIRELVQLDKPEVIPAVWKSSWKSATDSNKPAICQQIGCTFSTDSYDKIIEHFSNCDFKPVSVYKCKVCKSFTGTEAEVVEHIRKDHSSETNDDSDFVASDDERDSDDDLSGFQASMRKPYRGGKPNFYVRAKFLEKINHSQFGNRHATFIPALRWTMEFQLKNHQSKVFEDLKLNKFSILPNKLAEEFLPKQLLSMSMKNELPRKALADKTASNDWKKWKRFEADILDDIPCFFTGGPVWALAWLPISSIFYREDPAQYLAVSTHPRMNDNYKVSQSYAFKNSIQIWEIGHLGLGESFRPSVPRCGYVLAHSNGTVWSMEWCPSGAYKTSERMGLLAAGSSDGCVHIYSLPFPEVINKSSPTMDPPVVHLQPVMTLHVQKDFEDISLKNWQCMKISWSKTDGHNIIAAGFSNGYVALWDLKLKSSLLASNQGGTIHLDAFRHFYAHKNAVMHVEIIPVGDERYLATVGMDREAKTWDLEDSSLPVDGFKRGVAVNAGWISHWPALITSYDDGLGLGHTQTYLTVVREATLSGDGRIFPMLPTNSPCYGLATSEWANGICHGTVAGDIAAIFPAQMLYVRDFEKLPKARWLLSSAEIVDFEKSEEKQKLVKKKKQKGKSSSEYEYKPELYEECHGRFGIVFKNDLARSQMSAAARAKRSTLNSDSLATIPVEQYPFTSVNRMAWNGNAWSYLWLAAGYQNGLVRLLHLRTMSMNNMIKNLLPDHVKKVLAKEGTNCPAADPPELTEES